MIATAAGACLLLCLLAAAAGLLLSAMLGARRGLNALVACTAASAALMMTAAGLALAGGRSVSVALWRLHGFGRLSLRLDMLSAVFLFVAGAVYFSAAFYLRGLARYRYRGRYPLRAYGVLHFALLTSIVLILAAGGAILFLLSWECMAILSYLLVNYENRRATDRGAGYSLLVMSEGGFLAVVLALALLGQRTTSWSFASLGAAASHLPPGLAAWGFLLAFFGFGVKAGLVPVNSWLPRSYAAAPAMFLPVLAGVTLNLGFYGMLRVAAVFVAPPTWGLGLVALFTGSVTALVGILYATTENDLRKLLAHSSIENGGIIVAALGAGLLYRACGHPFAADIALAACLYQMVNHSIYKALLYQGVGEIEAATGTSELDRLGGLARWMPALSATFLTGCLGIAALPPFNGFVSEWLVLQSLLRSAVLAPVAVKLVFALCGAALALTAALAVTCFVRLFAMAFLGLQRGRWRPRRGRAAARRPQFSLASLAVGCLLLGVLPTYVIPVLNRAIEPFTGVSASAALVPPFFSATPSNRRLPADFLRSFRTLGAQAGRGWLPGRGLVLMVRGGTANPVIFAAAPAYAAAALGLLLLAVWGLAAGLTRRRQKRVAEPWAGGIPRLLPELTYTATGFSNPVRVIFQALFRPNIIEDTRETVAVHFRTAIHRRTQEVHVVERMFVRPAGRAVAGLSAAVARLHHGRLNSYVAYSLIFLVLALVWFRFS